MMKISTDFHVTDLPSDSILLSVQYKLWHSPAPAWLRQVEADLCKRLSYSIHTLISICCGTARPCNINCALMHSRSGLDYTSKQ